MAFKDKLGGWFSYFDTDAVEEEEISVEAEEQEEVAGSVAPATQVQPQQQSRPVERSVNQTTPPPVRPYPKSTHVPSMPPSQREQLARQKVESNVHPIRAERQQAATTALETPQAKIALKYPRKYEDAQDIVDLLIENECVLIDFQYMLDAQARRCLDFIDGASKVLFGSLEKVGSSMYLLTPANVIVNIEELTIPTHSPDLNYDYDMKRR